MWLTPNTVGFIVEPIQSEGGINVPPDGYLSQARRLCDRQEVLFIADEIQTGLGRTGKLFAFEWENIRPDVVIVGKALSGGFYPVSAVLADKKVLGLFKPGDHGSTFAGNPLGAAVAREALQIIQDEGLIENARIQGAYLLRQLKKIKSDAVKKVRGRGLLVGVELEASVGGAYKYAQALCAEGVLCKETHENVMRFTPPLLVSRKELDWALERIEKVLADRALAGSG